MAISVNNPPPTPNPNTTQPTPNPPNEESGTVLT